GPDCLGGDGGEFDPNVYTPRGGDILQNEDGSQFTIRMDGDIIGQVIIDPSLGGASDNRRFVSLNGTFITMSGLRVTFNNGVLTAVSALNARDAAAAGVPFATSAPGSGALSLQEQIELLEAQAAIARRDGDHAREGLP
ncbi:MAG: hypothetical protein IIC89_04335, partial [Chloroflexi bacterium]|nr:hypothetical protein [Chloroflexota bacterium]